ncbi:hypothetical protein KQH82_08140 [bacterium]|nr:hypothetical protein [bacterium]
MAKTVQDIVKDIHKMVDELAGLVEGQGTRRAPAASSRRKADARSTKGATGGVRLLVADGYFNEPRELSEVVGELKKEGRHYAKSTVSMALLSLTRERLLTRLENKATKNWQYVIRR